MTGLLLLGAPALVVAAVLHLSARHDAHGLERRAEMWAHRRLAAVSAGAAPAAFVSDGCSGGMSSLWREAGIRFSGIGDQPPWQACCTAHDRSYHAAGGARTARAGFDARLAADKALRACVARSSPDAGALAEAMYLAVRAAGGPCTGLPWRWGYGLPPCHPAATAPAPVD
ncbi:hypothetical protein [Halovulum marinum]|nr:hypothetical protein [Halovulum marinum]